MHCEIMGSQFTGGNVTRCGTLESTVGQAATWDYMYGLPPDPIPVNLKATYFCLTQFPTCRCLWKSVNMMEFSG